MQPKEYKLFLEYSIFFCFFFSCLTIVSREYNPVDISLFLFMKKIFSIIALLLFSSQVAFVSAASDNCKSYAYGYMSDGKIYMMLTNRKYGPFDDIDQLKFTLERL
jgi:hypothetical protein